MKNKLVIVLISIFMMISLAACNFLNSTQSTSTQTGSLTATATSEMTANLTVTETPNLTATVTSTPTSSAVMVSILENSNCRNGEGSFFTFVVLLTKGQVVEATGTNALQNYYYVRVPGSTDQYCWVFYYHASVTGKLSSLPVFTPQPTPRRSMTATPTKTPTPTLTPTITLTPTQTFTPTTTLVPSVTPVPSSTTAPTVVSSFTPVPTVPTDTPVPTAIPT